MSTPALLDKIFIPSEDQNNHLKMKISYQEKQLLNFFKVKCISKFNKLLSFKFFANSYFVTLNP